MIKTILKNEIINNNIFFVFLSIFMVMIAFMTQSAVDNGVFEFTKLLIESLLPLFFFLIIAYIFELINYRNISSNLLVVIVKSILFSSIPISISLISTLNLSSGVVDNLYQSIIVLLCISFYWFLLTTASIIWLRWKAVFILILFLFTPGISELLDSISLKAYLPFEIIMTVLKKYASNSNIEVVDISFICGYIVALIIIIKLKRA